MSLSDNHTYYQVLGKHIQEFVNTKWQSQNRASQILGIHPSRLSKLISGDRPPNADLMLRLMAHGFDQIHFDRWKSIDEIETDHLNKQELIELVISSRHLIMQQAEVIRILNKRLDQLI